MTARVAFTLLVALVALQRLWEVRKSARNERALLAAGGREHAPEQMAWMRALHATWLIAMLLEVWLLERAAPAWIAMPALLVFAGGQALRLAAMRALGPRWTVKILTVPGETAVASGIYRHVRHPNYAGVVLELAALPLVGGAYSTALIASIANAALLRSRIRAEERALRHDSSYREVHGARPRFVPSS